MLKNRKLIKLVCLLAIFTLMSCVSGSQNTKVQSSIIDTIPGINGIFWKKCVPAGEANNLDKLPFATLTRLQMLGITPEIIKQLVASALKDLTGVEDVFFIQQEIRDTCMADKYLAYAEEKTDDVAKAYVELAEAMRRSQVMADQRAHTEAAMQSATQALDKRENDKAIAEAQAIMGVYFKEIKAIEKLDQAEDAKICVQLKRLITRDIEIASLGKHVFQFAKENQMWAIKNYSGLFTTGKFFKQVGNQFVGLKNGAQLHFSKSNGHDKSLLAKAEKEAGPYEPIITEDGLDV